MQGAWILNFTRNLNEQEILEVANYFRALVIHLDFLLWILDNDAMGRGFQ